MPRRRRLRIDGDIQDVIDELALKEKGPSQIYRELERRPEFADRLPDVRTVQRRVKELDTRDTSAPWQLREADPEEARQILDVLAAVAVETMGEKKQFTKMEADWILRVRKSAPSMSPWEAWLFARLYMARESGGEETTDLDCILAFEPWRESKKTQQYFEAVQAGWIPAGPGVLRTLLAGRIASIDDEPAQKEETNDTQTR